MGNVLRRGLASVLACIVFAACAGCARETQPRTSEAQQNFEATVARADAARKAGNAESAFELYTEALRSEGATDPAGTVKARQEEAKRLMLVRRILATNEPGISKLGVYVQAVDYASLESTESAAAHKGLASCLMPYPKELRAEIASLRKRVKAGKDIELPLTVKLVTSLADDWTRELETLPQPVRSDYLSAVASMAKAASTVERVFEKDYYSDATLKELQRADQAIDEAMNALEAKSGD